MRWFSLVVCLFSTFLFASGTAFGQFAREQLYGLRKSSVLYQGTTLVGPHTIENMTGF
jgi:hypothetical protein